jgi:chromosome segregation ATPase
MMEQLIDGQKLIIEHIDLQFARRDRKADEIQRKNDHRFDRLEAAIGELSKRVIALTADVAELKRDVAELKRDVAELKRGMADLNREVAVLKSDVAILRSDVAELKVVAEAHTHALAQNRAAIESAKTEIAALDATVQRLAADAREAGKENQLRLEHIEHRVDRLDDIARRALED